MTASATFLGIDFGTSKSTMAWFNPRTGQAEIIKNAEGEDKTPSVVYFGTDGVLVGTPAENMLEDEEERGRVVASAKRIIGRPMRIALPDRRLITPLDAAVAILSKLKSDAEEGHFKEAVEHVVLTCPAAFSEAERDMLTDAAIRSGFHTVELLEEPVAAALAYARAGLKVEGHVLVYDLGGGTFDLAVLARDDDGFRPALAPKGLRACGGDDFDRALYDHCDELARRTLQRSVSGDERIDLQFLRLCRLRKENLTDRERCDFSTYLPGGVRFKHALERNTFEGLIARHVEETVRLTRSVVEEARDNGHPVATVVLIGGSSRVPLVRRLLLKDARLPVEPQRWQQQDVAVALGAAYQANSLWGVNGEKRAGKVRDQGQLEQPAESTAPREWSVRTADGSDFDVWTDAGLAQLKALALKGLAYLQSLNLGRSRVTDSGLAQLKGVTSVQSLNLYRCLYVTDAGLGHLKGLSSLQFLDLSECMEVTDVGLAHLKGLGTLHSLKLSSCPRVTDAGLVYLEGITSLLELDLSGCGRVTDAGLAHLKGVNSLRSVRLEKCKQVTDAGLAHLEGLFSLQSLDLCDCWQVTDAGLAHLKGLLSLRSLNLKHCQRVTAAGLGALQQALPSCEISR